MFSPKECKTKARFLFQQLKQDTLITNVLLFDEFAEVHSPEILIDERCDDGVLLYHRLLIYPSKLVCSIPY